MIEDIPLSKTRRINPYGHWLNGQRVANSSANMSKGSLARNFLVNATIASTRDANKKSLSAQVGKLLAAATCLKLCLIKHQDARRRHQGSDIDRAAAGTMDKRLASAMYNP